MSTVYRINTKILPLVISLLIAPQLFAQSVVSRFPSIIEKRTPTIATDKRNYDTSETVDIAGVDFLSYERVRLSVKYFDSNLNQDILLSRWDAYANGKGQIFTDWIVLDTNNSGSQFTLEAKGAISGARSSTLFSMAPLAGEAVDIDQCANTSATPQSMICAHPNPAGWINGNANMNNAKYFEGDSLPYRVKITGLTAGLSYTYTIQYDATENGINTLDYLTTYNRSITGADPCLSLSFTCTGAPDTIPIPVNPDVTNGRDTVNGTSDDIVQAPGVFTMWNGDMTSVSGYTNTGSGTFPTGSIITSVSITFTANGPNVLLAWGGHIATRSDWGQSFGAINASGSPFHMRNGGLVTPTGPCCGGNQDVQLKLNAVTATAKIIIIKRATPPSAFMFGFTTTNLTPSTFTLVDDQISTDPMQVFDGISTFNVKNITESNPGPYTLQGVNCTVDIGTGGTPAPVSSGNGVNIDIKSGDQVTCTFVNDFLTAATVSVSGRVYDNRGRGLSSAYVSVTDAGGNRQTVMTNQFGYYRISEVEAGDGYIFSVRRKGYSFAERLVNISDDTTGIDFVAQ